MIGLTLALLMSVSARSASARRAVAACLRESFQAKTGVQERSRCPGSAPAVAPNKRVPLFSALVRGDAIRLRRHGFLSSLDQPGAAADRLYGQNPPFEFDAPFRGDCSGGSRRLGTGLEGRTWPVTFLRRWQNRRPSLQGLSHELLMRVSGSRASWGTCSRKAPENRRAKDGAPAVCSGSCPVAPAHSAVAEHACVMGKVGDGLSGQSDGLHRRCTGQSRGSGRMRPPPSGPDRRSTQIIGWCTIQQLHLSAPPIHGRVLGTRNWLNMPTDKRLVGRRMHCFG